MYEVEWNNCVEMWYDVKTHRGFILDSMISKIDYKISENLEELCDGFYIDDGIQDVWKDGLYNSFEVFKDRFKQYKKCCIGDYIGYGFIKTDNCLKFVAKMNENGSLELV